MKRWQIENSETSEILFWVFLFLTFWFCPTAKIENWDLKISKKKFQDFHGFQPGLHLMCAVAYADH